MDDLMDKGGMFLHEEISPKSDTMKSSETNGISDLDKTNIQQKEPVKIRLAKITSLTTKKVNSEKAKSPNGDSENQSSPTADNKWVCEVQPQQSKSESPTPEKEDNSNVPEEPPKVNEEKSPSPAKEDEKIREKTPPRKTLKILSPTQINVNSEDKNPTKELDKILDDFEGFSSGEPANGRGSPIQSKSKSTHIKEEQNEDLDEPLLPSSFLQCNFDTSVSESSDFKKSQNYQLNCNVQVNVSRLNAMAITPHFCFLNKINILCGNRIKKALHQSNKKVNTQRKAGVKRKRMSANYPVESESFESPDVFTHSIFGSIVEPQSKRPKSKEIRPPPPRMNIPPAMAGVNPLLYSQNRFMVAFPAAQSPIVSENMVLLAPGTSPQSQPMIPHSTIASTAPMGSTHLLYNPVPAPAFPVYYPPPNQMRPVPPRPQPSILRQQAPVEGRPVDKPEPPRRQDRRDEPPIITLDDKAAPDSKGSGKLAMENFSCNGPRPSRPEVIRQLEQIYPTVLVLMKIGYPTEQKSIMNLVYQLLVAGPCCCMMHAVTSINNINLMKHLNLPETDPNYTFVRPVVPCIMKASRSVHKQDTIIIKRFVFAVSKDTRNVIFPLPPFCVPKENSLVDKITILMAISAKHGFGPGLVVYPHALLTPKLRDSFSSYPHLQQWSVSGHQSGGLTQSMLKEFLADVAAPWMLSLDTFSSTNTMLVDWWWSTRNEDLPPSFQSFQIINLQEMYSLYFDPLDIHLGINMQRLWGLLCKKWRRINNELGEHDFPRFFLQSAQKLLGNGKITDLSYHSGMLPLNYVKAAEYNAKQASY